MKFYSFLTFLTFYLLIGVIFCGRANAQTADSAAQTPLQFARQLYEQALGDESHLYNGRQYINYDKYYVEGHQFFLTDNPLEGGILYDGAWYAQVPMLYDIMLDKIVLEHPTSEFQFSLLNEKVKYFTFKEHTFIRLDQDSLTHTPLKAGFYDLLHNGKVQYLIKRTKNMQEEATHDGMKGRFDQNTKYFIQKDHAYYQVKDKRSVLKALPDKKKELQRHAREQKLKFGKNREKAILSLIRFYDQPAL